MPPTITGLYAGIAGLLLLVLSIRIIRVRRARQLAIGDGGDEDLARRIRAHANFTEYAPLALVLLAIVEAAAYPAWVVHGLGIALIAGRASHAWSMTAASIPTRTVGMVLTFAVLVLASALAIAAAL